MKLRNSLALLALFASACVARPEHEDEVEDVPPATQQYEQLANLPSKFRNTTGGYGLYKFYDIPEQKVCYIFMDSEGSALSCYPVDPDLKAERSNIYETPKPDR